MDQLDGFVHKAEADVWAEGRNPERKFRGQGGPGDTAAGSALQMVQNLTPVFLQADLTALGLPEDIAEILAN